MKVIEGVLWVLGLELAVLLAWVLWG